MHIRCYDLGPGPGPSERIVRIETFGDDGEVGSEEVVVDEGFLQNSELVIRRVVERRHNKALVELPQESATGRWRLWVKESALAGC